MLLELITVSAITIVLVEITVELVLRNHQMLEGKLLEVAREYYFRWDREIVHLSSECAQYDDFLSYKLTPGRCRFSNREFDTSITVNSAGYRDLEDDLVDPEIVVLGDSHSMGWGVQDQDAYPVILEKALNLRILNTAISSYGTARQIESLKMLELPRLDTLLIQYCQNDFRENDKYVVNGAVLPVMSAKEYGELQVNQASKMRYYPMKYSLQITRALLSKIYRIMDADAGGPDGVNIYSRDPIVEANQFLNVLKDSSIDLSNTKIIVFEVNGGNGNDDEFLRYLESAYQEPRYRDSIRSLQVIDVSKSLTDEHYFKLDDHMNEQGHKQIASLLLEELTSSPL